jgi:MerR family redox-sensitive transcriptional activator SoxR
MTEMTIGQVADKAGIRPSALRYYERVGLLLKPRRVSGQRRYDPEVLNWLAGIQICQEAGFTIEEIKKLFFGFPRSTKPSQRWRELATDKLAEVDELIRRANTMKQLLSEGIRCGCDSLSECTLLSADE